MYLKFTFILFAISLLFISSKYDNTPQQYWVSPNGNDTTGSGSHNNPWKRINYAMQQIGYDSTNGKQRILNVMPGIYSPSTTGEIFPVRMKNNLWLKGTDSSNTILDAENTTHVIDGWRMKNIIISDMTIQNGYNDASWDSVGVGGIACRDGTTAEIFNCIIQYCNGGIFSANEIIAYKDSVTFVYIHHNTIRYILSPAPGIYGKGGDVKCEYNLIHNCEYGGLEMTSGGAQRAPKSTIRYNVIRNCIDYGGGAIFAGRKYHLIENNIIINNETYGDQWFDEGGAAISASTGSHHFFGPDTIIIRKNFIVNNLSRRSGGAIASITCDGSIQIYNNVIAFNRAFGKGGAMSMLHDDKFIVGGSPNKGNDIFNNIAGIDSINLFYHDLQSGNEDTMNFQYNYLGNNPSKYHIYIEPDSLFDISNYTDTMNVCGKIFNCDSLFQALGITGGIKSQNPKPVYSFKIFPNYPNPFNPTTTIKFTIHKSEMVCIEIFNPLGQKIETLLNKQMHQGTHLVQFDAGNLPSGLYLYRIEAGEYQETKKMILLH